MGPDVWESTDDRSRDQQKEEDDRDNSTDDRTDCNRKFLTDVRSLTDVRIFGATANLREPEWFYGRPERPDDRSMVIREEYTDVRMLTDDQQ